MYPDIHYNIFETVRNENNLNLQNQRNEYS